MKLKQSLQLRQFEEDFKLVSLEGGRGGDRGLVQLEETDRKFNDYWEKHHVKLKYFLQLRRV